MNTPPCGGDACAEALFALDVEWAQEYAALVRRKDAIENALLDVCAQVFDRLDFDGLALPSVSAALGEDRVREMRRSWHDARATGDIITASLSVDRG